jgi:probable addiction module antidote protein
MKPWGPYNKILKAVLKDPKMAAGYINTALEEGDWNAFLLALHHVAEVHGGLSKLARKAKLHRVHLYRMLSKSGNPGMRNVLQILQALGYRLSVTPPSPFKKAA